MQVSLNQSIVSLVHECLHLILVFQFHLIYYNSNASITDLIIDTEHCRHCLCRCSNQCSSTRALKHRPHCPRPSLSTSPPQPLTESLGTPRPGVGCWTACLCQRCSIRFSSWLTDYLSLSVRTPCQGRASSAKTGLILFQCYFFGGLFLTQ